MGEKTNKTSAQPIMASVKCPHCNEDIEIVIAGLAMLPTPNSKIISFGMTWYEAEGGAE